VFHRQSIVFPEYARHAWHPPRLRVMLASEVTPAREGAAFCRGPQFGTLALEAECDLLPLVAGCGAAPELEGRNRIVFLGGAP
jgi:hypothetical protein